MNAHPVDLGDNEYHVYVEVLDSWKAQYTAAFTQLLSVGQPVEITFWPLATAWPRNAGYRWWQDSKTTLTWRGKILSLGSEVESGYSGPKSPSYLPLFGCVD